MLLYAIGAIIVGVILIKRGDNLIQKALQCGDEEEKVALVADDHDVVVEGMLSILRGEPDIEAASVIVRSGLALPDILREVQPDVLLLDARMPDFDLLSALGQTQALFPRLRVIVVTAHQDPQLVKAASRKGAFGYLLKEEALSRLLPLAIRDVAAGQIWFM